jgi:hypothetical protein
MEKHYIQYSFDAETFGYVRSGTDDESLVNKLTEYFKQLATKNGMFVGFINIEYDGENVIAAPENNWLKLDKATIETEVKELITSHLQQ